MKLAMPVWHGKVSPVFDTASRLLVVELENGREINRFETFLDTETTNGRCFLLRGLGVEILICGAITRHISHVLIGSGISVIAWISGEVEDVLGAYLDGNLLQPRFFMPGCRHGGHAGRGRRIGNEDRCSRRMGQGRDIDNNEGGF